jgi:hypothetical protein
MQLGLPAAATDAAMSTYSSTSLRDLPFPETLAASCAPH